jgi:hypothetical protein
MTSGSQLAEAEALAAKIDEPKELPPPTEEEKKKLRAVAAATKAAGHEVPEAIQSALELEEETPPAEEAAPEEQEIHACPRCRLDLNNPKIVPSDGELEAYIRCLLGDKPYTKQYTLYDNKMKVKFRTLDMAAGERLAALMQGVDATDTQSAITLTMQIKLLFHLEEFNDNVYKLPEEGTTYEQAMSMCKDRFGGMQENALALHFNLYNRFMELVVILSEAGFDSNFWAGAGLD